MTVQVSRLNKFYVITNSYLYWYKYDSAPNFYYMTHKGKPQEAAQGQQ